MRISLNNIKTIEEHLLGKMATGDALLFEANILLNENLASDVKHQQLAYEVVRQYGRQKIREEIKTVQEKIAAAPQHKAFVQRIANLFKKH